jgi:hypothetical protein
MIFFSLYDQLKSVVLKLDSINTARNLVLLIFISVNKSFDLCEQHLLPTLQLLVLPVEHLAIS